MRARERGPQGPLRPLRAALRLRPPAGARAAQQPAAGAPARLGGAAPPARGTGPLRPPAGRGRRGGRPQPPTTWGPGRPGAPAPQPARGRSNARPAQRPRRGLALRCGGVPPRNGWRPTRPGRACPALAATLPRPDPAGGWTGRAAASRRPGWAGERPAGRWGRVGRPRGPDGSHHHRRRRWPPGLAAVVPGIRGLCSADSGGGR